MVTVEKVLEIFDDYLKEDTACEVIPTKRGYIVGMWDNKARDYEFLNFFEEADDLKEHLLIVYSSYLEYKFTQGIRDDLTSEEQIFIDTEVNKMSDKFE